MGGMADHARNMAEDDWLRRSVRFPSHVVIGIYLGDYDFCHSCDGAGEGCRECKGRGWEKL